MAASSPASTPRPERHSLFPLEPLSLTDSAGHDQAFDAVAWTLQ